MALRPIIDVQVNDAAVDRYVAKLQRAQQLARTMRIHHWGNYRQPDAMAWNTTLGLTQFATGAG